MFCIRIQIIEYNVFITFNYFELIKTEPCEDFSSVIAGFTKNIPPLVCSKFKESVFLFFVYNVIVSERAGIRSVGF